MKPSNTSRRVRGLCAVLLAAATFIFWAGSPAAASAKSIKPAKPAAGILPAPAAKVLADLNAPAFDTREAMTRLLLADHKLTQPFIKWLIDHSTAPEQVNRLLNVARHLAIRHLADQYFGQKGSGSIGLTHESVDAGTYPWLNHGAIEVLLTAPGFPAYAHLQPGDIIVGFDGKPFGSTISAEQFKSVIEHHHCGEKISLTIHHAGKNQIVSLTLASSAALGAMYRLTDGKLVLLGQYLMPWLDIRKSLLQDSPPIATAVPLKQSSAAH